MFSWSVASTFNITESELVLFPSFKCCNTYQQAVARSILNSLMIELICLLSAVSCGSCSEVFTVHHWTHCSVASNLTFDDDPCALASQDLIRTEYICTHVNISINTHFALYTRRLIAPSQRIAYLYSLTVRIDELKLKSWRTLVQIAAKKKGIKILLYNFTSNETGYHGVPRIFKFKLMQSTYAERINSECNGEKRHWRMSTLAHEHTGAVQLELFLGQDIVLFTVFHFGSWQSYLSCNESSKQWKAKAKHERFGR